MFKTQRGAEGWVPLIKHLQQDGYEVCDEKKRCDVAVVLSGKFENSNCFDGKKFLVWHDLEWGGMHKFYKKIVVEYYDQIVDVTETKNLNEAAKMIKNAIKRYAHK